MAKKVAFFHTTLGTPVPLKNAFEARYPGVTLHTVVDDSCLSEIAENNDHYTPGIVKRLVQFGTNSEVQGCSVAVCMCTTLTNAVAEASKAVGIPFVTIDGPMLAEAVRAGDNLALLVTAKTTLEASAQSARNAAIAAGKPDMNIDVILVPGAFEAKNVEHDNAKHDALIIECTKEAAKTHDVVALAQVSMVDAGNQCQDLGVPVLTSLKSGIDQIEKYL